MLKKKSATAYQVYRDGGIKGVYAYARFRLQLIAAKDKRRVRLNDCSFSLEGISENPWTALVTDTYEVEERRAVGQYLRRDLPVVELGGSMGVVACVTNRLLVNPASHVVVEANPLVIPKLEFNRALNQAGFEIVNCAIAYGTDSVTFRPSSDVCASSIDAPGDEAPVTVQTVQLGDLVRERGFGLFNLICDIEGMEYELVCREAAVLKNAVIIIMETHARLIGEEKYREMLDRLQAMGFRLVEETGYVVVLQQS